MKTFITSFLLLASLYNFGQNVGVGTTAPTEKLDVNGNINLNGQLKLAGNAGVANQVLAKDGSNNLSWIDLSGYKNFYFIDCPYLTNSGFTCGFNPWTVPAGVTTIVVECRGGGGGGGSLSGGASGGFVLAKFPVVAGQTVMVKAGLGGNSGSTTFGTPSAAGGASVVTYSDISITAQGGDGGRSGNPFTINTASPNYGGGVLVSGSNLQYLPEIGISGNTNRLSYTQVSSTVFGNKVEYGNGGDPPLQPGSGGKGGYQVISSVQNQSMGAVPVFASGAGGGADENAGANGRGGRVIVHW